MIIHMVFEFAVCGKAVLVPIKYIIAQVCIPHRHMQLRHIIKVLCSANNIIWFLILVNVAKKKKPSFKLSKLLVSSLYQLR